MNLTEAIKIINYEKFGTEEECLEAAKVFFKELYGVDIQNPDDSYKSVYSIFEEASKCFK